MNPTLRVLLTPKCWMQLYPYSEAWDRELLGLMKSQQFYPVGEYCHKIGGCRVWTGNHPYASFRLEPANVRPSRKTILLAMDKLVEDAVRRGEE